MAHLVIQHSVKAFDAWKPVFDEHEAVRKKHGGTGHRLLRSADDPNTVVVILEFPSQEKAKGFASDPSLKEAMARAGVETQPNIFFTEEAETKTY